MKRQKKLAMIYQMSALCGMTIKILDQNQAGEISEDEYKAKLGEMKKHLAAFGSKYSRESTTMSFPPPSPDLSWPSGST
jgi:hypothetical protein